MLLRLIKRILGIHSPSEHCRMTKKQKKELEKELETVFKEVGQGEEWKNIIQ